MPVDAFLFPARAGMNRRQRVDLVASPSVPRTRGDEPVFLGDLMDPAVCSPHARG